MTNPKNRDQLLETIKIIFASDEPLSTSQIEARGNMNRRTVQRHIKRLGDAGVVAIKKNQYDTRELVCHRLI